MNNNLTCSFCNKSFSTISNLDRHKKTTKTCFLKTPDSFENIKKYDCEFCPKTFTSKQRLDYHMKNACKIIKSQTRLEEEVKILKEEVKQLKEHPMTTNNITVNGNVETLNNINNNISLTDYMTKDIIRDTFTKHYNSDTLLGGEKAFADFTIDYLLTGDGKPIYLCTDRSRQRFYYMDKNKKVEDPNADILTNITATGSFDVVTKLYGEKMQYYTDKINEHANYKEQQNYWIDERTSLIKIYNEIKNISKEGQSYRKRLSVRLPNSLEDRQRIDTVKDEELVLDIKEKSYLEAFEKAKVDLVDSTNGLKGFKIHKPTGMVFKKHEVVGKFYLNFDYPDCPQGLDDYKELIEEDKIVCQQYGFSVSTTEFL